MKIVHVIESAGGSMDFVLYLVKYLPQHKHLVIYGERVRRRSDYDEVKIIYPQATFLFWQDAQREVNLWKDIKAAISLYRLLREAGSEVVHLHSSKAGFLGRVVCFLQRRKKVIYTPNGLAFLRKDVSTLKQKAYIFLEWIAARLSGIVVACSKSEANELIARGVHSIYVTNGTEINSDNFPKRVVGPKLTIATTGRITIQKNPAMFNAIAKHFEENDEIEFLWIGSGELEYELTSSNIVITGWLDKPMVIDEVRKADIYLSTALWEGLPFAVLEAMSLRKPLVLTDCVGNIDLVKENWNGFIYNSTATAIEKITFLYQNRKLLDVYGLNSFDLVTKCFNVKEMADEYNGLYEAD